jgi:peptidyl-dipeptidase Dcp
MSALSTKFQNQLLAATKEAALVVADPSELAGFTDHQLSAAADAAKKRALAGKWVIPLQDTTQQPALASLKNRAVREKLFEASIHRADRGGDTDTRAIVRRLAELRARKAKLLGYATFAEYALEYQMAKTSERATKLLTGVMAAAKKKGSSEAMAMQKLASKDGVKLAPWDF